MSRGGTKKQRAMARHLAAGLGARESAAKAGYTKMWVAKAAQLAQSPAVVRLVEKARRAGGHRCGGRCVCEGRRLTREAMLMDVLEELWCIARANISDYVEVDREGVLRLKPTECLTAQQLRAVAAIKQPVGGRGCVEFRLYDKPRSAYMLLKGLGAFERVVRSEIEDLEPLKALLGGEAPDD